MVDIKVSKAALEQIKNLILKEKSEHSLYLRISVSGGGCSGFQYHFTLDNKKIADDFFIEKHEIGILIDELSFNLLEGSELDFSESLTSSSFVIKNPKAVSSCGCGNSFSL